MTVCISRQIKMVIPTGIVHGDKRDSSFDQPPGQQALLTNVIGILEVGPWINGV